MSARIRDFIYPCLPNTGVTRAKKILVLIDSCSAELFLNDGAASFTTHVYPTETERFYTITGDAQVTLREITPSVKDDFVV